jgi:glutaredoxin
MEMIIVQNMKLLFALCLFFACSSLSAEEPTTSVTLYYTPSCPHCVKVLNYLKKTDQRLSMKNVQNNVDAMHELRILLGGEVEVPVLAVGDRPIVGADDIIDWIQGHRALAN